MSIGRWPSGTPKIPKIPKLIWWQKRPASVLGMFLASDQLGYIILWFQVVGLEDFNPLGWGLPKSSVWFPVHESTYPISLPFRIMLVFGSSSGFSHQKASLNACSQVFCKCQRAPWRGWKASWNSRSFAHRRACDGAKLGWTEEDWEPPGWKLASAEAVPASRRRPVWIDPQRTWGLKTPNFELEYPATCWGQHGQVLCCLGYPSPWLLKPIVIHWTCWIGSFWAVVVMLSEPTSLLQWLGIKIVPKKGPFTVLLKLSIAYRIVPLVCRQFFIRQGLLIEQGWKMCKCFDESGDAAWPIQRLPVSIAFEADDEAERSSVKKTWFQTPFCVSNLFVLYVNHNLGSKHLLDMFFCPKNGQKTMARFQLRPRRTAGGTRSRTPSGRWRQPGISQRGGTPGAGFSLAGCWDAVRGTGTFLMGFVGGNFYIIWWSTLSLNHMAFDPPFQFGGLVFGRHSFSDLLNQLGMFIRMHPLMDS